ncbi:pantoate--beta-alanine ligase [Fusibacter ferrireducens]|uniref:Pantothenate synthetase n=1 Tax=Fusibacter ferrireducens TaxID=2785058 RepID=A0ABR9ZY50_9FIRM|nr:pantoate--beta-alanine ligase [Fusibacter ferrireducens]MBF4695393.1 pantoate--beta-alanine ligase [Fusibacter ferrireducens]
MKIVHTVEDLRAVVKSAKSAQKSVGLVPTMGFLHEGHLSLMAAAKKNTDFVVVSLFVNPTQFGPNEDLESYPRDFEKDAALCENAGVDVLFNPSVEEMYGSGYSTYVHCEGHITQALCGASRPVHFKGVTSVVSKLFNMVAPNKAFFGQKDAQQVAVIEKMVRELNFDLEIVPCPIVREPDGLALSSRNAYLSEAERKDALVLFKSLKLAEQMIEAGERDAQKIKDEMKALIEKIAYAEIDYVAIVDAATLESVQRLQGDMLIALAVKIGKPRLIDNIRLWV